jgi:Na+/H+-translocating membrane pyrophosphatase
VKAGYYAAAWSLVFAALHVIWACGWYIGLNPESAAKAFQKPWFLAYDLVVAGLCLVAASLGLALARPRSLRHRRAALGMGCAAAAILTLRGVAGLSQASYLVAMGRNVIDRLAAWDVWFCLGGMLFTLAVARFRRMSETGGTV